MKCLVCEKRIAKKPLNKRGPQRKTCGDRCRMILSRRKRSVNAA